MFFKVLRFINQPKVFPLFITVMIITTSCLSISGLLVNKTITVERNNVVLRQKPVTDAKAMTKIQRGEKLHVLQEKNDWFYVRGQSTQEGWIANWFIDNPNLSNEKDIAGISDMEIPLYQSTELDSEIMTKIPRNTYFVINQEGDGWTRIHYDNTYGFTPTKNIKIVPQAEMLAAEEMNTPETIDKTIIIRVSDQGFFDSPSIYGNVLYSPSYGQNFKYIETTIDDEGNEWYLAQDESGIRGYIESRITALNTDSDNHSANTEARSLSEATIMLDPGHGGEDVGALPEATSLQEKSLNLNTALAIKEKLEAAGAQVLMTRDSDKWLELDDRVAMSNKQNIDAFLSIHYDASTDPTWEGITTYYFHESNYDIAVNLNKQLAELPLVNNGVKFGNYQVIRDNNHPALLLELGYLTNLEDIKIIQKNSFNDNVATLVVKGLEQYFANLPANN